MTDKTSDEVFEEITAAIEADHEPSVPLWQIAYTADRWYVIPKSAYGLFTVFAEVGHDAFAVEYGYPDFRSYEIPNPSAIYFRDPEREGIPFLR